MSDGSPLAKPHPPSGFWLCPSHFNPLAMMFSTVSINLPTTQPKSESALASGGYDFNLLVSYSWGRYSKAAAETADILAEFGDTQPTIRATIARGIIGVKTCVDSRFVVRALRELFGKDPSIIRHTLKWVPIDLWTGSDMQSIKEGVARLRSMIIEAKRGA